MNDDFSSEFELDEFKECFAKYEEMMAGKQPVYFDADQFVLIAEYYGMYEDYGKSFEAIEYALNIHPGNSELLILKAHLLIDEDRAEEAQEIIYSMPESYDREVKMLKAELFIYNGELANAEKIFHEIIENSDEDNEDDYLDAAYLYVDLDYPKNALPWFEKAIKLFPEDLDTIRDYADCCYQAEEVGKSIDLYNTLLDKDPYSIAYWHGLGKIYYALNDFNKTIEAYDFLLTIEPDHKGAIVMIAHSYFKLKNYDEAVKYYLKYAELGGEDPELSLFFAGTCYYILEQYDIAKDTFLKALGKDPQLSPRLIEIYTYIAICHDKMGEMDKALEYIDKAIAEDEGEASSFATKGLFLLHQHKLSAAKEAFDKALELNNFEEPETYMNVGVAYFDAQLYDKALKVFKHMEKTFPDYSLSYIYIAYIYLKKEDSKNFKLYFLKAMRLNPETINEFVDTLPDRDEEIKKLILQLKTSLESI